MHQLHHFARLLISGVLISVSTAASAQEPGYLVGDLGWSRPPFTNAALVERIHHRALEIRKMLQQYEISRQHDAPRPLRMAFLDIAWPRDSPEYTALAGYAVLTLTAFSQDSLELPISRLYIEADERQSDLELVVAVSSRVPRNDSIVGTTLGPYRTDALYLIPVSMAWSKGRLLADFAVHRTAFHIHEFTGEPPPSIRDLPSSPATTAPPREAVVEFVAREFPDFTPLLRPFEPATGRDSLPEQVKQVLSHIGDDELLEVFKGAHHPFRMKGYAVVDIDEDGTSEVFVATAPYYRQSPTILIYTADSNGNLARVAEGLAPGPLLPSSGRLIDPHVLGLGVDSTIEEPEKGPRPRDGRDLQRAKRSFVRTALSRSTHVVHYRDFFHLDFRESGSGYIDLSGRAAPNGELTCGSFKFSPVDTVAVGSIMGQEYRVFLIAVAGDSLYGYRIHRIDEHGLLEKEMWAQPKPAGFARLVTRSDGILVYETGSGAVRPLPRPR